MGQFLERPAGVVYPRRDNPHPSSGVPGWRSVPTPEAAWPAQAFVWRRQGFLCWHLLLLEPGARSWARPAERLKRPQPRLALPRDTVSGLWALRRTCPGADMKVINTPKLSPFLSSHSVALHLSSPEQGHGRNISSHPNPRIAGEANWGFYLPPS